MNGTWCAIPIAISLSAALAAEPVPLRPRWQPGEERRYDLAAEYTQSVPNDQGRAAERRVSQTARLLIQVSTVEASGGATLRLSFESYHVEMTGPGLETSETFAWAPVRPEPEGEPTPLAALNGALAGCTMVAAVDGRGTVTTLTGLIPLAAALKEQGEDSPALQSIGFFSPLRLKANLSTLWKIDSTAPAREVSATWTASDRFTLGVAREVARTTTWTLAGKDGSIARLNASVQLSPAAAKREADPSAPRLEIKDQHGSISVEWDPASGSMVRRTEEQAVTWTATVDLGAGATTREVAAEAGASSRVTLTLVR